jgi:hypothetical protein
MTIIDIITQILETLYLMVREPINAVLIDFGSGHAFWTYELKVGFGNVEWFAIYLQDLLIIVLGLILGFIILRLIYRFIKWLFRLGKGLVGIR